MNNKKTTVYIPSLPSLSSDDLSLYREIHAAHLDLVEKLDASGLRVNDIDGTRASLQSMMRHAAQSDAFIFPPMTSLSETHPKFKREAAQRWFEFFSLVTGVHVGNKEKYGANDKAKPCVVMDPDGQWRLATDLLDDLKAKGMFSSNVSDIVHVVNGVTKSLTYQERNRKAVQELAGIIAEGKGKPLKSVPKMYDKNKTFDAFRNTESRHEFGVAMFGSASTKERSYIDATCELAKRVGQRGWRMSTGAGSEGCMGAMDSGFAAGCSEFNHAYPYTRFKPAHLGVSTQSILQIEGPPPGVSQLIITHSIYDRIRVMLKGNKSPDKTQRAKDATKVIFVVPGGTGTLHEFAAMMQLALHTKDMEEKKIVLFNIPNHLNPKEGFWDKLIETANKLGFADHFEVANSPDEALTIADYEYRKWVGRHPEHASLPHPLFNPNNSDLAKLRAEKH